MRPFSPTHNKTLLSLLPPGNALPGSARRPLVGRPGSGKLRRCRLAGAAQPWWMEVPDWLHSPERWSRGSGSVTEAVSRTQQDPRVSCRVRFVCSIPMENTTDSVPERDLPPTHTPSLSESVGGTHPDGIASCPKTVEPSGDPEGLSVTGDRQHISVPENAGSLGPSVTQLLSTEQHPQDDVIEEVGSVDQSKGPDDDVPGSTDGNDLSRILGAPEAESELPAPPNGVPGPETVDRRVEEIGSGVLLDESPELRKRRHVGSPAVKSGLRPPPAGEEEEDSGGITLNKCLLVALLLVGVGFGIFGHLIDPALDPDIEESEGDPLDSSNASGELHSHLEDPHNPQTGSPDPKPISWIPISELLEKLANQKQQIHLIHTELQGQKQELEESLEAGSRALPPDSQQNLTRLLQQLAQYLSLEEEILEDLSGELGRRGSAASRGQEMLVAEVLMLRRELDKQRGLAASMRQALEGLIERVSGLGQAVTSVEVLAALRELEQKLAFELQRSEVWEKVYGASSWQDATPFSPEESNPEAKGGEEAQGSTMSRPQDEEQAQGSMMSRPQDDEKARGSMMSRPQDEEQAQGSMMSRPQDEEQARGSTLSRPQDEEQARGSTMSRPQDDEKARGSMMSRPQDEEQARGSMMSRPQTVSKDEEKARVSGPQANDTQGLRGHQGRREEEQPESRDSYRQRPGKEGRPDKHRRPKSDGVEDRDRLRKGFWRTQAQKRRADCFDLVGCAHKDWAEGFGVELGPVEADGFRELLREYVERWRLGEVWASELQDVVTPFFRDGLFIHDQLRFTTFVDRLEDYVEEIAERVFGDDDAVGDFEDHVYRGLLGEATLQHKRSKKAKQKSHHGNQGGRRSAKHGHQDGRREWEKKWRPSSGEGREENRGHLEP
ncbi:pre-B-cell leukemia homeobox interacting protein 1b [Hemiscyllium ocellatum]|uniref:pre-B-cell leukemia homeobox interacting protein 1b n=1 Tax=Hemiscyllium ocellatum TaxID=170820 RepID=UPI0029673B93|nr:pre-B-cell leukemia homeobox interacting protein 1b [Hemiscyllium ocellatum]